MCPIYRVLIELMVIQKSMDMNTKIECFNDKYIFTMYGVRKIFAPSVLISLLGPSIVHILLFICTYILSFPGSLYICCHYCSIVPNDMMCFCVMHVQAGGLDRLTLDSQYDTAVTTAIENKNQSQHMEPVASSPSKNAQSTYKDSSVEKTIPASST